MKKLKIIYSTTAAFLLLCILSSFEIQETKGILFFNGSLKEALAKAKAENKLVFFDAYASWCGPCKAMEKDVFTDKDLGEYFNNKFVSIRIDMEKGEGPELAKHFTSIDGYPSLLFMNNKGNVIKTLLGSRNAAELLGEANLVK